MNNSTNVCLCEGIFIQRILIENGLFTVNIATWPCTSGIQSLKKMSQMANKHHGFISLGCGMGRLGWCGLGVVRRGAAWAGICRRWLTASAAVDTALGSWTLSLWEEMTPLVTRSPSYFKCRTVPLAACLFFSRQGLTQLLVYKLKLGLRFLPVSAKAPEISVGKVSCLFLSLHSSVENLSYYHSPGFIPFLFPDLQQICPVSFWFCLFVLFLIWRSERMDEWRDYKSKGMLVTEIGKVQKDVKTGGRDHSWSFSSEAITLIVLNFSMVFQYFIFFIIWKYRAFTTILLNITLYHRNFSCHWNTLIF